jgi:pimeloyl-ACP methyl ester carboxylesterase
MDRYVNKVRTKAFKGRMKQDSWPYEMHVIHPKSAGRHLRTFVFLHGFKMEASEMLSVFSIISESLPTWRFVLPQAPDTAITAHEGQETISWYNYLSDTGGESEDTVDIFSLRSVRMALQKLVSAETALLPDKKGLVLGGLSQGGTMALHMATFVQCQACVTAVACRLSNSVYRSLKCPWHALVASRDDVFPWTWSQKLMKGSASVQVVDDTHYLECTEVGDFFLEILRGLEKEEA